MVAPVEASGSPWQQGRYRNRKGNKVVRTLTGGGASSDTPPALADPVGVRASSGETELTRRGYTWRGTEKTGTDSYSCGREYENGRCLVVRTSDGRYASIAYAMEMNCNKATTSSGGGDRSGRRRGWAIDILASAIPVAV
jgi:hypothetical protein